MASLRHLLALLALLCPLAAGCSGPPAAPPPNHPGPKVNVADFIRNTAKYKGSAVNLVLKVNEEQLRVQGKTLQDYAGKEVKFSAVGPKGEQLHLVIAIDISLLVPESVGYGDEVTVTFVCTRGSLKSGNEARTIKKS